MDSRIIVSGGDARYFPMILELINSIRQHREGKHIPIGIIDGGLTHDQKTELAGRGINVAAPYVPDYVSKKSIKKRHNLSISVSKLWLNNIFSGYSHILWIDADAWVQEFAAVELLFGASACGHLAIIPQAGRYWEHQLPLRWIVPGFVQIRSILYKNATHAGLSWKTRKNVANRAVLNGGIYAMRGDAPHWPQLQAWQKQILGKNNSVRGIFTSDQLALSLVVYENHLPVNLLPESCNYMGPWRINGKTGKITEYYYPYNDAGIVHLAGQEIMRLDPLYKIGVVDTEGVVQKTSLRFNLVNRPDPEYPVQEPLPATIDQSAIV